MENRTVFEEVSEEEILHRQRKHLGRDASVYVPVKIIVTDDPATAVRLIAIRRR